MKKKMKKTKTKDQINSLADIQKRIHQIYDELEVCEEKIGGSYFKVTHPLFSLFHKKAEIPSVDRGAMTPLEAGWGIASKLQRVSSVVGIAFSIYNLVRRFKK